MAAVGLGSVIFSYLLWAFGFLRMGTTGLIAQAKGREDVPDQVVTVIRSSGLAVFFGLLLFVFQEALLALSLKAMAPADNVAAITSEYFRIRIWAAPSRASARPWMIRKPKIRARSTNPMPNFPKPPQRKKNPQPPAVKMPGRIHRLLRG